MERESGDGAPAQRVVPHSKTVAVVAGNRIELPAEWC